jgi:hypothetical protein
LWSSATIVICYIKFFTEKAKMKGWGGSQR